jgi:hypothetical protein
MRPAFTRMKPIYANGVFDRRNDYTGLIDVLCVECGWEAVKHPLDVDTAFLQHPCRLVTESVSTAD